MGFELKKKQINKNFYKLVAVETPNIQVAGKKAKYRVIIEKEVFDIYDSVADNAKMISLIFSLLYRIYDALPNDIKNSINEKDRQIIEYAFEKFKSIKTRADVQFQTEGLKLIDKLMDRQYRIAKIIEETK